MVGRPFRIALTGALLCLAPPVHASTTPDPVGDFLPSYTGARSGDLDILSAGVTFDGVAFRLGSTQNGLVGSSTGSLFVWGINRGAGSARLTFGAPPIGQDVLFDAVAVLFPDGSARVATFPAMGAPVITPLPGAASVTGSTIAALIPLSLLPSTGFAPQDYRFTLWSRLRVDPAMDGTNAEIADFAPTLVAGVPEPASWAMMIVGFGAVGGALRHGRRRAAPARSIAVGRSTARTG